MTLQRAAAVTDDAEKLEALLQAWRTQRHPRIAGVIDDVSERLVKAAGPVKERSKPVRVAYTDLPASGSWKAIDEALRAL